MKKTVFTLFFILFVQLYFSQVSFAGNPDYGLMRNFVYDKTTPNKIYATTYVDSHILVSNDNGVTWNVLFTLPLPEFAPDIQEMRLTNNGTALSFIEFFGGGSTWNKLVVFDLQSKSISKEIPIPQDENIFAIKNYSLIDEGTTDTALILTSGEQDKVFKTTNGGSNWNKVYDATDHESVLLNDAIMDPKNPQNLYIARNGGAGNEDGGLFKSTDGGATWTESLNGLILQSIDIDPNNSNVIYVGTGVLWTYQDQHQAVYKSVDGGNTWTEQTQITWSTDEMGLKNVPKIHINPNDSNHVLILADDRIAVTTNGGTTWTTTEHAGLTDGQSYFYGIGANFNPFNLNEVLIANNRYPKISTDKGVTLSTLKNPFFEGMGNLNIINDNGTDKLMYGVQYGYTIKNLETNEEKPISVYPLNETPMGAQIGLLHTDKDYPGRVYTFNSSFMGSTINVSNDYGATTIPIHSTFDNGFTSAETDSANPNIAWLATFNGVNATLIKANFANPDDVQLEFIELPYNEDYIYGIKSSQNNPNEVLVTVGNKILKTTDGGSNWTEITIGLQDLTLPNIALGLTQNPLNLNQYTISASNGIYTSLDGGNNWTKIYTGMVHKVEHSTKQNGQIVAVGYTYLDTFPKVIYSNDNGNTWTEKASTNYFNTIVISGAVRFVDNMNAEVYLTSQSLGILKDQISLEVLGNSDLENLKSGINVYPNPTKDFINIKLEKGVSKFKASLYNAAGQMLLSTENRSSINISNLNTGIYFLTIQPENGKAITKKIIKN
ncbi:Ycf48-like protein [compost metagenome]